MSAADLQPIARASISGPDPILQPLVFPGVTCKNGQLIVEPGKGLLVKNRIFRSSISGQFDHFNGTGGHSAGGSDTGKVISANGPQGVGTDANRTEMWTREAAAAYNEYIGDLSPNLKTFQATGGYVNVPLDGLWLRAPYLHNGSVPTLAALLEPPDQRPAVFWRGLDEYDPLKVGFVSDGSSAEANGFRFEVSGRGNGNQGHLWGTTLSNDDETALLEYLKTL